MVEVTSNIPSIPGASMNTTNSVVPQHTTDNPKKQSPLPGELRKRRPCPCPSPYNAYGGVIGRDC